MDRTRETGRDDQRNTGGSDAGIEGSIRSRRTALCGRTWAIPMKLLFLPSSQTSPSSRFRLLQFADPLRKLGHDVEVRVIRPDRLWRSHLKGKHLRLIHNRIGTCMRLGGVASVLADSERFDVIFINCDLIPEVRIRWIEPFLARWNQRLVFDFDDAIFLGPREHKLRHILPHFAAITAGNEYLARFARELHGDVTVLPTVVDTDACRPAEQRAAGPLRIGWSGSRQPMHACLPLVGEALSRLAREMDFEFVVICDEKPPFRWPGVKTRFIRWSAERETADLQQIDIGLMPLPDSPFARGKCGAKALLYLARGIPALVSPVGVNREIVLHGVNGLHCPDNTGWYRSLRLLAGDESLRRQMGRAGRLHVERNYLVKQALPKLLKVFQRAAAAGRRSPRKKAYLAAGQTTPAGNPSEVVS